MQVVIRCLPVKTFPRRNHENIASIHDCETPVLFAKPRRNQHGSSTRQHDAVCTLSCSVLLRSISAGVAHVKTKLKFQTLKSTILVIPNRCLISFDDLDVGIVLGTKHIVNFSENVVKLPGVLVQTHKYSTSGLISKCEETGVATNCGLFHRPNSIHVNQSTRFYNVLVMADTFHRREGVEVVLGTK